MNVRVLYFAGARDLASRRVETVTLREGASVEDLAAEVVKAHPSLGKLKDSLRFSVNLEVVDGESKLRDGDEVGVLPPVAGG